MISLYEMMFYSIANYGEKPNQSYKLTNPKTEWDKMDDSNILAVKDIKNYNSSNMSAK
ncbi:MAG: hypothetical protein WC188_11015 [Candidatus Caldatribacteriota bacterium]